MLVFLVSCCSTEEQALMGVSLDAQEEKIRAYCVAKDWDLSV
jgi:DNA invertase Pin-like site-specific DNA recombinase